MVEHRLAKARVAGSNPVSRSNHISFVSRDTLLSSCVRRGRLYLVPPVEMVVPTSLCTTDMLEIAAASVEEAVRDG